LSGRDRKELNRRAAEARNVAQRDAKNPRSRWDVDRWSLHFLEEATLAASDSVGTVVSVSKGRATVRVDGEDVVCELTREVAEQQQALLAPGDEVRVEMRGDSPRIRTVLPRRTYLSRRDPHFKERERTIVANVDVVVIVVSVVAPPLHPRLIDRYLAAVSKGGAAAMVVVNKLDLHTSASELALDLAKLDPYREMGVSVFGVSTSSGEGVEEVRAALAGRTSVFVGHSGVGKSSLLNAVAPEANALAGSVADVGKGRHTTTRSELVEIGDLRIVDTPGVREFAVEFGSPSEVAECFREFSEAGRCRFGDCVHVEEPGCAVREAVRLGRIARVRYLSYRRLIAPLLPDGSEEDDDEPPDERLGGFACRNCGSSVPSVGGGTRHRNHCPRCLHSLHLDATPGDRAACCGAVMEPIAVWVRKGDEWAVVHRCRACGHLSSNRIAADDNEALLLSLAVKPLSRPPFPLERLAMPV